MNIQEDKLMNRYLQCCVFSGVWWRESSHNYSPLFLREQVNEVTPDYLEDSIVY